jgi:RND superfamily putative drug exporter
MTPDIGPLGRLGRHAATHVRAVLLAWVGIAVVLGALAPRVETALSGAGWQANGSQSVAVRSIVQKRFAGRSSSALLVVLHSPSLHTTDPAFAVAIHRVERVLRTDAAIASVTPPSPRASISADGRTAIVVGGARRDPTRMVAAADRLKGRLAALSTPQVQVNTTGASAMWSDFNAANRSAMMRSELLSWPVTLAILVLAFGSLVAAGLPLMLTITGLVASAGVLFLGTQLADISIWAMNFALMFALALGIDYALFIVARFRAALLGAGLPAVDAAAVTMDTAGKAVLFVLGAALSLLPAVLAWLGPRVDRLALSWVHSGDHRSPWFAAWAERLWRRPLLFGGIALAVLLALAAPVAGLRTGMPSIKVVPQSDGSRLGYDRVTRSFGPGAPGTLQILAPVGRAERTARLVAADRGIAQVMPPAGGSSGTLSLIQAVPRTDPSAPATGATIDRLRAILPAGTLVGGAAAENHDLEAALSGATPRVIGVVLLLGFALLLIALANLLATGAAFGVARLIFQDGHGASVLGFQSQGFLDAWGPVFFFAMIFAIAMDYTVFLLASAKEHHDRSGDPHEAMVGGVAHSGRVILAAAAVMVAVFFTFALSGPLPPKEMGVILGIAVFLDALLVRLVIVPVALRLLGRWAWWLPRWAGRVLPAVRFGHS